MPNDAIIKNDVDLKEEDPLERAMPELQILRDLVSRSPVHFAVYDAADRLIAWNSKYEENHPEAFEIHRAEADAGTLTYRQLLEYEVANTTPPEDREAELERLVAAQRGCDGTPVDRFYQSVGHVRVYKYPLSSGAVAGLAMDINDMVNARIQLSKAREESNLRYDQLNELMLARSSASKERAQVEERYRLLVDHAPDGITIVDLDTVTFVEEANPRFEALFGLSRNELLGKLGPKDVSPEFQPDGRSSAEAVMAYLNAAFVEGTLRFEWLGRTAEGRDFPCQVTCIRFPHPTRRMVRASIVDLTEQTHAEQARLDLEQKLARSHRLELVGQMTGGVAHDFNNVLSILLGNLELLDEKAADPETRSVIRSAMEATEHGARLTRAMLNYSRQAPLHPETFKVSDVVRRMESLISRTIPSRISIETDFEDESWAIAADVSNTESAILNLVLNSYDATPNNGLIKIRTASVEVAGKSHPEAVEPGCYTVLTIQDSGEGIPDDVLEKIFEPFFTTKGVGQNSGLGLSMVQGFMSQSGGFLNVESQVGVGTVIKLYFPAVFESVPVQTEAASTNVDSVQGFTVCIMLVEDNPGVSELMETRLKLQGHEVLTANSADSAIEVYKNAMRVDLLISDIAIPGSMQGPQLAQYFKKSQPDLPVIFISGYSFGLEAKEAGLLESDVLLTKPVRHGDFIAAVNQMLASSLKENSY